MKTMRHLVENDEVEKAKEVLESTPLIKAEVGYDWIVNNLLNVEERLKKHPLFWLLLEPAKIQKLEKWLIIIKACIPDSKFKKIINSIRESRAEKEFYSLIPELEVLAYYGSKGIKIEYEPDIPEKKNVGDVKLTIGSTEVFIEITRLFESQEEEKKITLVHAVVQKIEAISDNPFIITLEIKDSFNSEDIEPCIKLVNDVILKSKGSLEPIEGQPYVINFENKATIKIHKKITHKKGYVGGSLFPAMEIKSASRVKNKLLDKLEQLPERTLNVVAVDLSYHFADFDDVENAFVGQLGYVINRNTGEGRTIRNANGVIHMKNGHQIGLVIAFKGFNYEQRKKYENSSASTPFAEEMLEIL
jgi:hypothetical protein